MTHKGRKCLILRTKTVPKDERRPLADVQSENQEKMRRLEHDGKNDQDFSTSKCTTQIKASSSALSKQILIDQSPHRRTSF